MGIVFRVYCEGKCKLGKERMTQRRGCLWDCILIMESGREGVKGVKHGRVFKLVLCKGKCKLGKGK